MREGEAPRIQLLPGEAGDVNLLSAALGHPVRPQNRSFRRCQEDLRGTVDLTWPGKVLQDEACGLCVNFCIENLVEVPCLRRQIWRRASRQSNMADEVVISVDNDSERQNSANSIRCRGTETEGQVSGPSFRAHQGMHLS